MGGVLSSLRAHWPEYLIEAAGLGTFMVSAGFCVMLANAADAVQAVASPDLRRAPAFPVAGRHHAR